ncbi:MAG: carboxypeptidase regulatory-like domain-containing protein [Euryarchaeota archaeon]|nr:carboxypeptidase regulatory-like domain-containing protein [Euryarchaeota archaeon]
MRGTAKLAALGVVAILLGGCVSGESKSNAAASTSAPPPTVSADEGSISGQVLSEEIQPIGDADVAISGPSQAVGKSDAQGKFTFNGLAPGEYTVIAQRLGFDSEAKKVVVEAGIAAEVTMTLQAIAIGGEPRREVTTYDGFIDGDAYTFAVGLYYPRSFTLNVSQGAGALVVSMAWESSAPLFVRYMRVTTTLDGNSNTTKGRSPQTVTMSDLEVEKKKEKVTVAYKPDFACGVDPLCFAGNPDALVPQIAYQQRVKFYNTVFYNEAIPDGYTGLP